ncbi:MAG: tRNA pseudouridine(55) synthase TruB [Treponema sp.]|jgi:tRNA pseudouridine55 synthase|nr:tRNA pseudouridine(55) synthase TruB [Treponema sp.]
MRIIFLNKEAGITSFDALRDIKRRLKTGKVGHTGTLDKFARGLLIVLTGRALKLTQWFIDCDKQYIGKIRFGKETDTLDPEGEIIEEAPEPSREEVEGVLSKFTGKIMQSPPAYSALHINGKRAHELARSGQTPEMKKRPVTIYKLELCSWQPPFAEIFVHCSSGTYIRSLARDIALEAGSRGHLVELERTQIGKFILGQEADGSINKAVISKLGLPVIEITPEQAKNISHGKDLQTILEKSFLDNYSKDKAAALFYNEELAAIIQEKDGKWVYGTVVVS